LQKFSFEKGMVLYRITLLQIFKDDVHRYEENLSTFSLQIRDYKKLS